MLKGIASLVAISGLLVPTHAVAQTVEFDSGLGKYRVSYHSGHLGRSVVALVEPPDKIDPSLRLVRVDQFDGDFSYEYTALNHGGKQSRQPVVEFDFDCPDRRVVDVTSPPDWEVGVGTSDEGFICILIEETADRHAAIGPGQMLGGLKVRAPMLPAIGVARFWGKTEDVRWPEGESMEALDLDILRAVQRLAGPTGGWVERVAVVPIRDARGLGPLDLLQGLERDLDEICEEREWISGPLCRSYRATLSELITAIGEERWGLARAGTVAFLSDIEADHKGPAQQQLQPDAYWLLRKNLEAVLAPLEPGTTGEHSDIQSASMKRSPEPALGRGGAPEATPGFWSRLWSAIRNLPIA